MGSLGRPGTAGSIGTQHGMHDQHPGTAGSVATQHGIHGQYPDAQFMGGPAPGSAGSTGTVHNMHPGYRPGAGYAGPGSAQPTPSNPLPTGQVFGKLKVRIIHAYRLKNTDLGVEPGHVSDPFVVIKLGKQPKKEHKTDVVHNNLNPAFNSPNFEFDVQDEDDFLKIEVFNASQFYSHDSLGKLSIPLHDIVSYPGEVQPRRDHLQNGGEGELEYEILYIPPEQVMAGVGRPQVPGRPAPFMQPAVELHHKVQHKIPLPDFHGFGRAAFDRPPPEVEIAKVGEKKRQAEYESFACHLGQYDYDQGGPNYFPSQDAPQTLEEKHRWKEDPFYKTIEEPGRHEQAGVKAIDNKDPFGKWLVRKKPKDEEERRNQGEELVLWNKDPFHDWLKINDENATAAGIVNEKIQEVQLERKMMKLPSFHADGKKRFEDNREYAHGEWQKKLAHGPEQVRPRHDQSRFKKQLALGGNKEHEWKEDAFFGWLPGRGTPDDMKHELHRPFEDARLARLPSFSDDKFLGLKGKGIGVLKVWVRSAKNLHYNLNDTLRGKPSACVMLSVTNKVATTAYMHEHKDWNELPQEDRHWWTVLGWDQERWDYGRPTIPESEGKEFVFLSRQEQDAVEHLNLRHSWDKPEDSKARKKITPTIETNQNPVWNTGAFQFEVQSNTDTLLLEVVDLLGQDQVSNVFLGRLKKPVHEMITHYDQQIVVRHSRHGDPDKHSNLENHAVKRQHDDPLEGVEDTHHHHHHHDVASLTYDVLYQPYVTQAPPHIVHEEPWPRVIRVRPVRAIGLTDRRGGFISNTSPYIMIFKKHDPSTQKRTVAKTGTNPVWHEKGSEGHSFDFELHNISEISDSLVFIVAQDGIMEGDGFLGRMEVPIQHLFDKLAPKQTKKVLDTLKDQELHSGGLGQLEVEIFWTALRH